MKYAALILTTALLWFSHASAQNVIWNYTGLGAAPATDDKLFLYDTSATASKTMTIANLFTSPTLTTPTIGVATATSINGLTLTSSTGTLTIANGKTLTASNTLTFTGTDSTSFTFPATSNTVFTSTLSTNDVSAANSLWGVSNGLVLEGATADTSETTLTVTDPTADRTVTIPDATGTVILAQASTAVSLTADNQAVAPAASNRIQLSSDNATATNRTFTLSATGAITGQIYILIGPASNGCEIADTGIQKLSATWSPGATDTLTLLFDGTNFIELARADN